MATEFWFGSSGAGLAHGFRSLGWDVVEVDLRDSFVQGGSMASRLAARLLRRQSIASYNRAVLQAVDTAQPGAFLTVKGNFLLPGTLRDIRRRGIKTINYYPDYHFDYADIIPSTFTEYDLFFTTKSFQLQYLSAQLGAHRAHFLHHGYSSLVHRPRSTSGDEADYVADVAYIGNHSAYKESWIEAVARGVPEATLMIVGNGWGDLALRLGPRAIVSKQHLLGDLYARALSCGRINLAFHSGPDKKTGWQDLVSTRTFEIPACKAFMLHVDNDEVRSLYEPGTEIGVFATPDELCEKIRYYFARPDLRRSMIERAYTRCVPAYSYDVRARTIVEAIVGMRGSGASDS